MKRIYSKRKILILPILSKNESINKHLINILLPDQKEEILDIMFNSEPNIFKKVFINDYQNSLISKKYWIPFINEKIVKLFGGENK